MSAINGKKYFIPRTGPEAVASWSTRLSRDNPSTIYQMDPLSSPNDLSPLHMATTPIMWMTPTDMKIFLRPQDEALVAGRHMEEGYDHVTLCGQHLERLL